jgi:catechol 2,3-dioxygenase-like lactoylglutathione lyase family enzyme
MPLTAGPHHLATITADMDRLIAFYARVFEAKVTLDMREDGLRHVFIDLGGGFVLHPFEIPSVDVPQGELPMFGRGRIDHLALRAETPEDFWTVRERIYEAGASDGQVTDLGVGLSAGFTDPDGLWGEVCLDRPPDQIIGSGEAGTWTYIEYPDRA